MKSSFWSGCGRPGHAETGPERGVRSRSVRRVHGGRPVRADGVLHRREVAPAAGATSSRHRRSGRCSAPSSLASSMPSGDGSVSPTEFVVVDAGAGPGTLARSVLSAEPACAAGDALRRRGCVRGATGAAPRRCRVRGRAARRPVRRRRSSRTNCSTTCPFRLAVYDDGWREAFVVELDGRPYRRTAELGVRSRCRPYCPRPAALGARAPLQDGGCCVGRRRARAGSRSGTVVAIDYTVTDDGRVWRCGPGGNGCAPTGGHERGGHYLDGPGYARTSPPRSPSTSCPNPMPSGRRRSGCSCTASPNSSTRVVVTGRRQLPDPTSPRSGCGAASAKPRRCSPQRTRRLHRRRMADLTRRKISRAG